MLKYLCAGSRENTDVGTHIDHDAVPGDILVYPIPIPLLILDIYLGFQSLAKESLSRFGTPPNVIDFIHSDNYLLYMRISVFDQWGAQNSLPVWAAFRTGAARLGHAVVSHDMTADVAVIWSLVWAGRMRQNQAVWQHYRSTGRPVVVLEVGTLRRGHTWKMGINGLGNNAQWGQGSDPNRASILGVKLDPWQIPGDDILIVAQRWDSEQWAGLPPIATWLADTVSALRKHTDRRIRVRRHPRQSIQIPPGCEPDIPQRRAGTYDEFDLDTSIRQAWAVVNVNSGAGVKSVIHGVPLFCDASGLAAPVANLDWNQIESPQRPDRAEWFLRLCHTEWTTQELAQGWPLERLLGTQSF
jgi:hypothetical protein